MTTRLYLVPLPDSEATRPPEHNAQSRIDVAGLVGDEGGLAAENVALQGVDLTIQGHFRAGPTFSRKLADELDSLGESSYEGIALFDPDASNLGDKRGYYEINSVDVNPVHQTASDAFSYSVTLDKKGTRNTHWRAVETNEESIGTGLATGDSGLIGVPSDDLKERWFDPGSGAELATATSTVSAEFGDVDLFDPGNSTFDSPALLFEQPYDAEGSVDVRVWDDRGESEKYASFADGSGGTVEITQWVHAFHSGFEFEGQPIADNGLVRVRFDEANGQLEAWEWDDSGSAWSSIAISHGDYHLFDADVESIGPAEVSIFAEFEDTTGSGGITAAVVSIQRGIDGVILRQAERETVSPAVESIFDPVASDQTTDPRPAQTLTSRTTVK